MSIDLQFEMEADELVDSLSPGEVLDVFAELALLPERDKFLTHVRVAYTNRAHHRDVIPFLQELLDNLNREKDIMTEAEERGRGRDLLA